MARSLAGKENVVAPGGNYPYGRIRDKIATTRGTKVNENVYGDFHQFFAHLMDQAGLTHNGEPDNDYVGFQYFEAFMKCVWKAISLPSTSDELASGSTNVNDFVKPGCYSIASSYTNIPSGLGATAKLLVSGTVGVSATQIIFDLTNGAEWLRTYTAPTTYSTWSRLNHNGHQRIGTGDSFNDFLKPGFYLISSSPTKPTNGPDYFLTDAQTIDGVLIVGQGFSGDYVTQNVISTDGYVAYRQYNGSSWSSWAGEIIVGISSGTWDMDTDVSKTFAHGLTASGIRGVEVIITPDGGSGLADRRLDCYTSQAVQGGVIWDSSNLILERLTGGIFDGANYNDTILISNRASCRILYSI